MRTLLRPSRRAKPSGQARVIPTALHTTAVAIATYLPPCPKCQGDEVIVYCTRGAVRFCKCRDCDWTFRAIVRPAPMVRPEVLVRA